MAFEAIQGQEETARRLRATLRSGRFPHAWLFVGAPGIGRLAMARELAQVLLCDASEQPDDYCGTCAGCRALAEGNHADYMEVGIPEGKQKFRIDDVRDIQDRAALRPRQATRRVFVILDADRMSDPAANCFLKTLEEPPGDAVFILIAASLRDIRETTISRCRCLRFPNLPPETLQRQLEADGMDAVQARWLALRTWGNPGLARACREAEMPAVNAELVAQLDGISLTDNFRLADWFEALASESARSASQTRVRLQEFLEAVAVYYRDLAVAATCADEPLFNDAARELIRERSAGRGPDEFIECAGLVMDAMDHVAANAQRSLALYNLFTQIALRAGAAP